MNELAIAVQEKLTRTVGVSNYKETQMLQAYSALARHKISLASNQVEYNLLNRRIEKNGLLARCRELDIRLIAYSPLAMGLLTGKYSVDSPPPGMRGRRATHILPKLPPLLKLMTQIGQEQGGKNPTLPRFAFKTGAPFAKGKRGPSPGKQKKTLKQARSKNARRLLRGGRIGGGTFGILGGRRGNFCK